MKRKTALDKLSEKLAERYRVIFDQNAIKSESVTGALIAIKEVVEAIHEIKKERESK